MVDITQRLYGDGDASYRTAGELEGIIALVDRFYNLMDSLPEAKTLRDMHAEDLAESKQKLVYFLSGWLRGPKLYSAHFGAISLPVAHRHLPVDRETMESWLLCMERAMEQMGYPVEFREYLISKFATPAESIRLMCEHKPGASSTASILATPAAVSLAAYPKSGESS